VRTAPERLRIQAALACFVCFALVLPALANAGTDVIRFGLFTDLHAHDVDSPLDGKWMTHTEERVAAFVDAMNGWDADFVIELGDYVNGWLVFGGDLGDAARIPDILAWTETLYAGFEGPRYHVLGNHDVYNLSKQEYLDRVSVDQTYYSFDVGAFHFVVLDLQYAEDGTDLAYTYSGVAGFVPEAEIAWLQQDLAASDDPTIVFVHQMLDQYVEELGRALVSNQPEVQGILEADGDVVAVFQGHDHDNAHDSVGGIHYVTFEALVDQGTPPSWASITLDPSSGTIRVEGAGAQVDYELRYVRDP
jgi:hypothetical protein